MRIIFVRHGDPDYKNDSLTEKGIKEAKLLSERIAKWPVTEFYCSPLGRAKKTASYTLERLHREAVTYEWMREFSYYIDDPTTGRHGVPWDFMPEYWTEIPQMYDKDAWKETEIYRSNPELLPAYQEVCDGIDGILEQYGYKRYHNYYLTENQARFSYPVTSNENPAPANENEKTIVIFCHLGVTFVMMSHLLGVSPAVLFHGFYVAPTSVTILATEERMDKKAYFRAQVVGDTTHLLQNGEKISISGYFTEPFQY